MTKYPLQSMPSQGDLATMLEGIADVVEQWREMAFMLANDNMQLLKERDEARAELSALRSSLKALPPDTVPVSRAPDPAPDPMVDTFLAKMDSLLHDYGDEP